MKKPPPARTVLTNAEPHEWTGITEDQAHQIMTMLDEWIDGCESEHQWIADKSNNAPPEHQRLAAELQKSIATVKAYRGVIKSDGQAFWALANSRKAIKRRFILPKITAATLFSICSALLIFLGNLDNSPLYRIASAPRTALLQQEARFYLRQDLEIFEYQLDAMDIMLNVLLTTRTFRLAEDEEWLTDVTVDIIKQIPRLSIFQVEYGESDDIYHELSELSGFEISGLIDLRKLGYFYEDTFQSESDLPYDDEIIKRTSRRLDAVLLDYYRTFPGYANVTEREITNVLARFTRRVEVNNFATPEPDDFIELLSIDFIEDAKLDIQYYKDIFSAIETTVKNQMQREISFFIGVIWVLMATVFVFIWIRDRLEEAWVEDLLTDEGAIEFFRRLCNRQLEPSEPAGRFSKSTFQRTMVRKPLLPYINNSSGLGSVQAVVPVLLDRLLEKKVIREVSDTDVQSYYEIPPEILWRYRVEDL